MSDLLVNIRFGKRHLQINKNWKVTFRKNSYWDYNPMVKYFEVYDFFS